MKVLIILTEKFPYESSETFLEDEVIYWDMYDKVYIIPIAIVKKDRMRECENSDVRVIQINNARLSNIKKTIYIISALFSPKIWREISVLKQTKRFSKKNLTELLAFYIYATDREKQLKKLTIDITKSDSVTFYSCWLNISAYIASDLKKLFPGSVAVSRGHRCDIYENTAGMNYLPFRDHVLSGMDKVYLVSDDGCQYLCKNHPQYADKCSVARIGSTDRGTIKNVRSTNTISITSCSYVVPVKRIDRIIDTLSQIKGIEVYWTHIGQGDLLNRFREEVKKLPDNIHVNMPGYVSTSDLIQHYKQCKCNVFVNVSDSEGVPLAIMEAMSYGIPIIATDVGGTAEIVEDGKNGLILNRDFTDSELGEAIVRFAKMPDKEFDGYCASARSIWSDRCNKQVNYNMFYEEIYNLSCKTREKESNCD